MNPVGIMQGRLSPAADGRIQSFPAKTWRKEFDTAAAIGLDCIEWIYETGTEDLNPLRTDSGIEEIRSASNESGVAVRSICADYYMDERLVFPDGQVNAEAVQHLCGLVKRAADLGADHIVLPFVDSSSLAGRRELEGLLRVLKTALAEAESAGVELHLETDLEPTALADVLSRAAHPILRANYDTGNSASLGYAPEEELRSIGSRLGSVHVKDRVLGGSTVALGEGSADLDTCFRMFRELGYARPYILQAARDNRVTEAELAARNMAFVQRHVRQAQQS